MISDAKYKWGGDVSLFEDCTMATMTKKEAEVYQQFILASRRQYKENLKKPSWQVEKSHLTFAEIIESIIELRGKENKMSQTQVRYAVGKLEKRGLLVKASDYTYNRLNKKVPVRPVSYQLISDKHRVKMIYMLERINALEQSYEDPETLQAEILKNIRMAKRKLNAIEKEVKATLHFDELTLVNFHYNVEDCNR